MPIRKWTPSEDAVIQAGFPNYGLIASVLTWRTRIAIKWRSRELGLTHSEYFWSERDKDLVRRCVERGEGWAALKLRFPDKSKHAISQLIRRLSLKQPWEGSPARTDSPHLIITDIKRRCLDEGVSFMAISRAAGTDSLLKAHTIRKNGLSHARIAKAVELLGGELYAEWED